MLNHYRAYLSCDKSCCEKLKEIEKTIGLCESSGATALSVLLVQGEEVFPKALYVANCGDTRGVLCEEIFEKPGEYEARRLSYDHKAADEEEVIRIKSLGGRVKNGRYSVLIISVLHYAPVRYKLTMHRVNKILSVARAFGDHYLKNLVTAEPFCPDPVLVESAAHCPFMILACDGKN